MKVTIEREDCKLEIQGTEEEVLNVVRPVLFPYTVKAASDLAENAVNAVLDDTFDKMECYIRKLNWVIPEGIIRPVEIRDRFVIIYKLLGLREQFVKRLDIWYTGYARRTAVKDLIPKTSFITLAKDIEKGL